MNKRDWKSISYEAQGLGHIKENIPCQDKTYSLEKNNVISTALSDGAGSAKYSHIGAEIATRTACQFICDNFEELISSNDASSVKRRVIDAIVNELKIKAQELEIKLKELSCTLLLTGIKEDKFLMFHIGDGIIGYLAKGAIKIASTPVNGEFANTTIFINSSRALEYSKLIKGNSNILQGIVMMSDGTAESLYSKRKNELVESTKKIINFSSILKKDNMLSLLKNSFENLVKQNTQDDCSISILMPTEKNEKFEIFNLLSKKDSYSLMRISEKNRGKKRKLKNYKEILEELVKEDCSYFKLEKKVKLSKANLRKRVQELIVSGVYNW